MDYKRIVSHDLTGLDDHELSAIQAGLTLLANNGRVAGSTMHYPEYKETAAGLLGKLGVNGYNHDQPNAPRPRLSGEEGF